MQHLVPLTHDSDTDRWKARDNIKMENQAKKRKRITFTKQCFTNWTNGCLFVLHQAQISQKNSLTHIARSH